MSAKELVRKMAEIGWSFQREGKGSHRIYSNPKYEYPISVPFHGSRDIPKGLLQKLLKQSGLK